ncbi:MAG: hypothetical protein OXU61_07710 [Gammaproteobacteria bacterium]|nr:hypothetical protein [Gammaproteobacteria bacterium]
MTFRRELYAEISQALSERFQPPDAGQRLRGCPILPHTCPGIGGRGKLK